QTAPPPLRVELPLGQASLVLAAGAHETPAILMRSGLGDREALARHGIDALRHMPRVGKGLHDRVEATVTGRANKPFSLFKGAGFTFDRQDPAYRSYEASGHGGLYGNNGQLFSFELRSGPDVENTDLKIIGLPVFFRGWEYGFAERSLIGENAISVLVLHTNNGAVDGTVELRSADPGAQPIVNYRNITPEGLKRLAVGVRFARELMGLMPSVTEDRPGPDVPAGQEEKWIEDNVFSHHEGGGTNMAPAGDPDGVVDPRFRLNETNRTYVIGSSVFPRWFGKFPMTQILLWVEKWAREVAHHA
ncbi:MAG: GMC family oxidoreductase, partial [Elusimicrobia bacterium]|nr:GMC family oxidoreductase [Elusimicrobiota bacterium]